MVKLMSQAIENQLISSRFQTTHHLFWFNTSPENIDSQWSSLLVFNDEGIIVSANRRAEVVLGQNLALQRLEQLFDVKMEQVLSHPPFTPFALTSRSQSNYFGLTMPPTIPKGRQLDFRLAPQTTDIAAPTDRPLDLEQLNTGDPRLAKAINQASRILDTDIPILIHGETGWVKKFLLTHCTNQVDAVTPHSLQ